MTKIMCALSFSLSHERIRQTDQLVLKWCLFMWFWPEHALIWNWPHIPQNLRKLQNLIVIVFYIYPAFQNAINHLFIIYDSKVKDKSLEVASFRLCTDYPHLHTYSGSAWLTICHQAWIINEELVNFKNGCHIQTSRVNISHRTKCYLPTYSGSAWLTICHHSMNN